MSFWTSLRNAAEDVVGVGADYLTGGLSGALGANSILSKGSQTDLSSGLGQAAQFGAGLAGMGVGSSNTGIPESSLVSGAGNYLNGLYNTVTGGASGIADAANITPSGASGASGLSQSILSNPAPSDIALPIDPATPVTDQSLSDAAKLTSQQQAGVNSIQNASPYSLATASNAPSQLGQLGTGANASVIPPAAATPGATGVQGILNKGMAEISAHPFQAAQLGMSALNMAGQKPAQLNPNLMAGAAPSQAASSSLINNFNNGQMTAADQANISQFVQQQTAQIKQYYASAGLSGSSMEQQALAGIQAQSSQMSQQALNNQLQQGLSAAGVANGATQQAVQLQVQQDQQAQQAQQQFMQAMAQMSNASDKSSV